MAKSSKKVTHYQEIVNAVKKIGGKGTIKDIFDAVDTSAWKSKRAYYIVASLIYRSGEFSKQNNMWIYTGKKNRPLLSALKNVQTTIAKSSNSKAGYLYLITVPSPILKTFSVQIGLPFKIGMTSNDIKKRLEDYSRSLPYQTIQELEKYQFPKEMTQEDYKEVEDQVRTILVEKGEKGGLSIEAFGYGKQKEWQYAKGLSIEDPRDVQKVRDAVDNAVKEVFSKL